MFTDDWTKYLEKRHWPLIGDSARWNSSFASGWKRYGLALNISQSKLLAKMKLTWVLNCPRKETTCNKTIKQISFFYLLSFAWNSVKSLYFDILWQKNVQVKAESFYVLSKMQAVLFIAMNIFTAGDILAKRNWSATYGSFTLHGTGTGGRTENGTGTIGNNGSLSLPLSLTSVNIAYKKAFQ